MIRIIMNTGLISIQDFMFDVSIVIGIGNNSTISSSKIMQLLRLGRVLMRMVVVWSFFGGRIRIQMGIFFLGVR